MDTVAEIHEELANTRTVEAQWLKIPSAVRYSDLSRSKLYQLIEAGKVRSVCLRQEDAVRGTRLIWRPSLDAYFNKHEGKKSEQVPGRKGRKSKKAEAVPVTARNSNLRTI